MADSSSERKKDSTPEGGVFDKQTSVNNGVIVPSHSPSKPPKKRREVKTDKNEFIIIFKYIRVVPQKKFKT